MAEEKQFIINVRRDILKKPIYKRTKKAITSIKEQTARAMHTEKVKIGTNLNNFVWSRGTKNPPTRLKLHSIIEDDYAVVELQGFEFQKKKEKKEKTEGKKTLKDKIADTLGAKEKKETQSKQTETNKELAKETQVLEKKEHSGHHPAPGTPDKTKSAEVAKEEKMKNSVFQDKKKAIGEA